MQKADHAGGHEDHHPDGRSDAVGAVDQVDRVNEPGEPEEGQREEKMAQVQRMAEQLDAVIVLRAPDDDRGGEKLKKELPFPPQSFFVVDEPREDQNQRRAQNEDYLRERNVVGVDTDDVVVGDPDNDRQGGDGVDDHAAANGGRRFLEFAQAVGFIDHAVTRRPEGVAVRGNLGNDNNAQQKQKEVNAVHRDPSL